MVLNQYNVIHDVASRYQSSLMQDEISSKSDSNEVPHFFEIFVQSLVHDKISKGPMPPKRRSIVKEGAQTPMNNNAAQALPNIDSSKMLKECVDHLQEIAAAGDSNYADRELPETVYKLSRLVSDPEVHFSNKDLTDASAALVLVAEECQDATLQNLAGITDFVRYAVAVVDNWMDELSRKQHDGHVSYQNTVVTILMTVETAAGIRRFCEVLLKLGELEHLITALVTILLDDIAYYTQETALDILCRLFVFRSKSSPTTVSAEFSSVPECLQESFTSIGSAIKLLKDMRPQLQVLNRLNKFVTSFPMQSISLGVPKADSEDSAVEEKPFMMECWLDFNLRCISFVQSGKEERSSLATLPYCDLSRVHFADSTLTMQVKIMKMMIMIIIVIYMLMDDG